MNEAHLHKYLHNHNITATQYIHTSIIFIKSVFTVSWENQTLVSFITCRHVQFLYKCSPHFPVKGPVLIKACILHQYVCDSDLSTCNHRPTHQLYVGLQKGCRSSFLFGWQHGLVHASINGKLEDFGQQVHLDCRREQVYWVYRFYLSSGSGRVYWQRGARISTYHRRL